MGSNVPCRAIRPDERAVDLWNLRRGKVLALVGPSEARRAKRLAQTCRVLAQAPEAPPSTRRVGSDQEWDGTLEDSDITQVRVSAAPTSACADEWQAAAGWQEKEEIDWDEERPTRIVSVDFFSVQQHHRA